MAKEGEEIKAVAAEAATLVEDLKP